MSKNKWHTSTPPIDEAVVVEMRDGLTWIGWIDGKDDTLYLDGSKCIHTTAQVSNVRRWRYPYKYELNEN